jgi:hypothetical protein
VLSALDVEPDNTLVEVQRLVTVPTEEYVGEGIKKREKHEEERG